jgi:hypothetical protein
VELTNDHDGSPCRSFGNPCLTFQALTPPVLCHGVPKVDALVMEAERARELQKSALVAETGLKEMEKK